MKPTCLRPSAAISLFVLATLAGVARAQETPAAAEPAADRLEDVAITGTRVKRSGYLAPVPTTTVTAEDIQVAGNSNLADTLNDLPEVNGGLGVSTSPASGNYVGNTDIALRGLGAARTLVLVDGERFTPSSIYGTVSTSLIPQMLVKQVDVVTGGASAQYGSDAIAGVVNFVLDHGFEGLRGNVQGGATGHGDYGNYLVSLAFGHSFADGRAHVELAGDYGDNKGVGTMSRDWLRAGWQTITNPNYNAADPGPDQPRNLVVPGVTTANASYGGVILSPGPLAGQQFGPDGGLVPFSYGTYRNGSTMLGGDGVNKDSMIRLAAPLKRATLYGHVSYDVLPDVQAYLQASYGYSLSDGPLTLPASAPDTAITISADNAFLIQKAPALASYMTANNIASFTMGRWSSDYAMNDLSFKRQMARIGGGFKGTFGRTWSWNVNYSYGWTNSPIYTYNNENKASYKLALDAVFDQNGRIVCRSTLTSPGNGCVPLDLLGVNAPSRAAINYVQGTSWKEYDTRRTDASATLNGEPFSTWAGPVSFATGVEFRRDSDIVTADPIAMASGWAVSSQVPFSGSVRVWEGFGELVMPLVKDQSWTKELDLDVTAREVGYTTSGRTTVWKAGLSWAANDSIRLRADRSRDFRAPALTNLFQGGSSANANIIDRWTSQTYSIYAPTTGNSLLQPETADTTTIGLVLTPTAVPGLVASIDYYDIRMQGLIVSVSAQGAVDACYYYGLNLADREGCERQDHRGSGLLPEPAGGHDARRRPHGGLQGGGFRAAPAGQLCR